MLDYRSGSAVFYLLDNVAYDIETHETRYWIEDEFWFGSPMTTSTPDFIEKNGYVFDYPRQCEPLYFCSDRK